MNATRFSRALVLFGAGLGHRKPGDMFGETSLLKSGIATASVAAEETTVVICLEGDPISAPIVARAFSD